MANFRVLLFLIQIVLISTLIQAQTVHIVEVKNFVFVPADINIAVGDTVEWQWIEGTHTTTSNSTSGQNVWDAPVDFSHQVFRFVITSPGIHNYHCTPHQSMGMIGTITATAVNSVDEKTQPEKFQLNQNYPNPFNPTTSLQYAVSSRQFVTLKVYDLSGREVARLVNEEKPGGEYEVVFNGTNLPSGIYFYQLKAGEFSETKKMILLK
jgi:plastocyanin